MVKRGLCPKSKDYNRHSIGEKSARKWRRNYVKDGTIRILFGTIITRSLCEDRKKRIGLASS